MTKDKAFHLFHKLIEIVRDHFWLVPFYFALLLQMFLIICVVIFIGLGAALLFISEQIGKLNEDTKTQRSW